MLNVLFVLTPNFSLLDYAGPAEALKFARQFGAELNIATAASTPTLGCSLGLQHSGFAPLPDVLPDEALVIVTGAGEPRKSYASPEALATADWLRDRFDPARHQLATVCTAALLAARAGLLCGRRCTTHHGVFNQLREIAPSARIEEERIFVEDGPVASSAGMTTGIDLALWLIERHFGPALAQRVARNMVVYMRRTGAEARLSPWLQHRNHMHPAVHRAQDFIAKAPDRAWTLAEIADAACVSPRSLTRLFRQHAGVSVREYAQSLQLAHARTLLETSALPIERVAEMAGFASARDFRRVWQRAFGSAPRDYRRTALAA